ncbi:hypothetical protein [Chryseobacterium sp. c4a]|uniref:hypothetical protein n=1 Tax=Chryseobacterium sp. c4a TaxID=1573582 RepID=UPI00135CCCC1|nr:hypothetical protein [Chryseobacterium sp. c4a]
MKKIRIYSCLLLLFSASLISCRGDDFEEELPSKSLSVKNSKIISSNVVPTSFGTDSNKIDTLRSGEYQEIEPDIDQEPKGIPPKK